MEEKRISLTLGLAAFKLHKGQSQVALKSWTEPTRRGQFPLDLLEANLNLLAHAGNCNTD